MNAKKAGFIYPLEEVNYTDANKIIKIGVLNNAYNYMLIAVYTNTP